MQFGVNILPLIEKSINHRSKGFFFYGDVDEAAVNAICVLGHVLLSTAGHRDFISDNNCNGIL